MAHMCPNKGREEAAANPEAKRANLGVFCDSLGCFNEAKRALCGDTPMIDKPKKDLKVGG